MSPTPVTYTLPTMPASYAWEATDEEVSARYGAPVERIVRFDLNSSPTPPALAQRVMAAGRFQTNLSDYPPGDYGRLTRAAAEAYGVDPDELGVGAGADEILDLCAKAFLPPNGVAIVPAPTYAMYRVVTEQRPARLVAVDRKPAADDWAIDTDAIRAAVRAAAATGPLLWLCDPNNPTGTHEAPGVIARLLDDLAADADEDDRQPPMVVLDNAYAEFAGPPLHELRHRYPSLVVVRTASKAYALAGLRVGFAIATAGTARRLARYRPPGSISTVSATVVTEAFLDPTEMRANVERLTAERPRLAAALMDAGWRPGPSVTNFLLLDLGSAERAAATAEALLRRGLVPRTFGAGHPLAHCLRVTVRSAEQDDRLIQAANEIERERAGADASPNEETTA
jgi:histidinol-phosphate aminotransferase